MKIRIQIYKKRFAVFIWTLQYIFFENHKALNISFKKVALPGRVKCGGTEEEIVVAHGCRKRKKLICGTEEEIVVVHGRLPSLLSKNDDLQILIHY